MQPEAIAAELLAALDGAGSSSPIRDRLPRTYGRRRLCGDRPNCGACASRRGERPIGRKIGFTNRNIWAEYGVYAPIWGDVYADHHGAT